MRFIQRVTAALFVIAALPLASSAAVMHGQYTLIGGTPGVSSVLTVDAAKNPLRLSLHPVQSPLGRVSALRDYEVDATKKQHVIVLSDDFRSSSEAAALGSRRTVRRHCCSGRVAR